ncbi:hypothetical protein NL676_007239 [Syzygium grande]|nr:hypothetical protein NL676_007239 [Syzygium grande]
MGGATHRRSHDASDAPTLPSGTGRRCGGHALKAQRNAAAITPTNITASINSIPMLNGTNFKSWQENLLIVLGVMDLDLAKDRFSYTT